MDLYNTIIATIWLTILYAIWAATEAGDPGYGQTAFLISGIAGHLLKNSVLLEIQNYWYLLLIVLVGGQIGNFLNLRVFPTRALALVTAFLVLFVTLRLGINFF